MKTLVVLSGAGMSAESGIKTFRDDDGLWNNHRAQDLATPQAFNQNPELVLDFYNWRRKIVWEAEPNSGHLALVKLEEKFDVHIITQNVDDLHERAGSKNVLHLHGEIKKARSSSHPDKVYELPTWKLSPGDKCEFGSQLRPHIVWFGEPVEMIVPAMEIASQADVFIVIGTSLVVYPAAGLLSYVKTEAEKYFVDPNAFKVAGIQNLYVIPEKAGVGIPKLVEDLLKS
ncbi:MAG: NAD-dependent deacylase [Bacteroidales bacterium]|nr:NAD-dependent deacylase [Bacteroidales bacterium]